jgi:hypothetical protein
MRPRILFLCTASPFGTSGSGVRTLHLARLLARIGDLRLAVATGREWSTDQLAQTKAGTRDLLEKSGYLVERIEGIHEFACSARDDRGLWKYFRLLRWLLLSAFQHGQFLQYAVVARIKRVGCIGGSSFSGDI